MFKDFRGIRVFFIFGPEIDDHMPEIRQISQKFTKFYLLFKYDVSKMGGGS